MQSRDLIPVVVLLGCSELDLLLNSLAGGCGPGSGRGGLPCHLSMGWHSMNSRPQLMAAPAPERKARLLLCCRSLLL